MIENNKNLIAITNVENVGDDRKLYAELASNAKRLYAVLMAGKRDRVGYAVLYGDGDFVVHFHASGSSLGWSATVKPDASVRKISAIVRGGRDATASKRDADSIKSMAIHLAQSAGVIPW